MEQIKMRLTNAVAASLSAAPHSAAKAELIEELSGNLYRRYLDLAAEGVPSDQAYAQALDDLGDTEELVEYLKGLEPEEELPRLTLHPYEEEARTRDELDDLLGSVDQIVRDALGQARDALHQAGKSTWRSNDREFEIHFDEYDDDHGEHPYGEDHEDEEEAFQGQRRPTGSTHQVMAGPIPAQGLRGVDVQTVNGDITIRLEDREDILLEGDTDELEVTVSEKGLLSIRQGRTASSSFFFLRGLSSADVILTLPRRRWELIQISAVNGDIQLDDGLELDRLLVKTTSGDLSCDEAACTLLSFQSASGDLDVSGFTGTVQAETASGDIRVEGNLDRARLSSMSGDVELEGTVNQARLVSASGDLEAACARLPQRLDLSSKSGDCTLRLPDTAPFSVHYKTVSGQFRSDFFPGVMGGRKSTFTHQEGQGPAYHLSSISGDLYLYKS